MGDRNNLPKLPKGWVWGAWKEIGFSQNGRSFPSNEYQNSGIKLLRPGNLHESGKVVWTEANTRYMPERWAIDFPTYIVGSNELVMNLTAQSLRDEFLGRVCLTGASEHCLLNQRIARLTPIEVPPKYLLWMFKSPVFRRFVDSLNTGSLIQHMFTSQLEEFYLPLPPLAEQHRIVAKIEELFTQLDAGVELLKKLKAKLKRYRQAVLKAAVEGKLTKDWREAHQGELEPASVLLERILKERREKWEAEQLAQMKAKGKTPKNDSWKLKYKYPVAPNISKLPELPKGWVWTSIEQISQLVTDGDHNPPKRVSFGIPHLTARNVINWTLSEKGCTYISEEDFERVRKRYEPLGGDVIITCVGTVGRTAIIPNNYIFSADRNLAVVRLVANGMSQKFLLFNLNTSAAQKAMSSASGSTAQPHFYLADIRAFPVALAPVVEQLTIVEEVERHLSVVDKLETVVNQNLKRAEKLRQSILKKAFEGKLVPQDPTDEPADKLLERIKAEKAKREAEAKAKKKRKQPGKSQQVELF